MTDDLTKPIASAQRLVWAAYVFVLSVFCALAWRVGTGPETGGIGLPIWETARPMVYGAAVFAGIGALALRQSVYARGERVREAFSREIVGLSEDIDEASARARMRQSLAELSGRERSVWTLSIGPAVLGLPSVLLSADALPMVPLAAASLVLLVLTFPREH